MFSLINKAILQIDIYLASIGLIGCLMGLGYLTIKLYRAIRVFVLPRLVVPDLTFYGEWAVVTGGSSGIGKSFAHRLASLGMNIVIISNELEALKSAAQEIEFEHRVQCCYIHADFTEGIDVFDRVMDKLGRKDIGILVNGAGISGTMPCYFLEETEKNILAMINLHILSVVCMTLKIVPLILAKKKGVIVNISSIASVFPYVLCNIYSPCKAFSDRFTRALCWEYKENSYVRFQSLIPWMISTRLTKLMNLPPWFKILATDCERYTASAVSTISATSHTTGYWIHELIGICIQFSPTLFHKISLLWYMKETKIKLA